MRTGEAIIRLVSMGYHFELVGDKVRYEWQGHGDPDAGQVSPLLDFVRQHKDGVRYFLKCYCPRCGGCCFVPDYEGRSLCLGCDWAALADLYPDLKARN